MKNLLDQGMFHPVSLNFSRLVPLSHVKLPTHPKNLLVLQTLPLHNFCLCTLRLLVKDFQCFFNMTCEMQLWVLVSFHHSTCFNNTQHTDNMCHNISKTMNFFGINADKDLIIKLFHLCMHYS